MILEIFETHPWEEDKRKQLHYMTALSHEPSDSSVVSLNLAWLSGLKEDYLWDVSFVVEKGEIMVNRFYPFGEGIEKIDHRVYFSDRKWRVDLLGRWIAACIEVLLLWQFVKEDVSVHTDPFAGLSLLRLHQLQKYWIPKKTDIRSYLTLLAVHFHFPQHHISKFPSWINEREILQLSEKE